VSLRDDRSVPTDETPAERPTGAGAGPARAPVTRDKPTWRAGLLSARAALSDADRLHAAEEISVAVLDAVVASGATSVAAYVPVPPEPGPADLVDRLRGIGTRVVLPIVTGRGHPLQWAVYDGGLVTGPLGLQQPPADRGAQLVVDLPVDLVIAPALAVDHRGVRLGRGGAYYDRALAGVPAAVPVIALVYDDEYVPLLPADDHDRRVTAVITPGHGLRNLRGPGWTEYATMPHDCS
jgi:5-formyltetrahydrofolate cyclo-ligase